jgi:hypothetical protein
LDNSIIDRIQSGLSQVEEEESVTVLYACESGSRAWGFESTDSDYDVRFIYLRRTPWYLAMTRAQKRDVIERPIDANRIDMSGWDIMKALELFRSSNPPLLEWLQSPIVYRSTSSFADKLRALMPQYYSPKACIFHYMHMAAKNFREYLKGDEVWTKKYFYVLRPVLASLWIEKDVGAAPTEFRKLLEGVVTDGRLRKEIDMLLAAKRNGQELRRGPRNEVISSFLESQLLRLSGKGVRPSNTLDPADLERLFLDVLVEVNGETVGHSQNHEFEQRPTSNYLAN